MLLGRLRRMHALHVRGMCRVTRKHMYMCMWHHHISTCELSQRLGLDSIDMYIARRQLRWLGHVARMDYDRLPRRMLSAWVPHRRPIGEPRMTYRRSIFKALAKFGIDSARWHLLAADRAAWRETLRSGRSPRPSSARLRLLRRPSASRALNPCGAAPRPRWLALALCCASWLESGFGPDLIARSRAGVLGSSKPS